MTTMAEAPHDPDLDGVLQRPELTTPDLYPALNKISAGFIFKATLSTANPDVPEYISVTKRGVKDRLAMAQWNMHWEAAQYRKYLFDEEDLPAWMSKIVEQGERNICFVPRTRTRYYELAPLYHLLPKDTLIRHGLPVLSRGLWPHLMGGDVDRVLPDDTQARLSQAWARTTWRHLMPGSRMLGFTKDDPIRLLAHNLDYWIPPATEVIQARLRELPQGGGHKPMDEPAVLTDGTVLEGARMTHPRMGSNIWVGEEDAAQATKEIVDAADSTGNLRGILDAVRSHRVEDDFSHHWTYAKEDFERKIHRKRSKVKVTFVELTQAPPIHGPESEVIGNIVCNDFMALLDPQDQRIVILLSSGVTKLHEVASTLGYANHSPVSKRLARIRQLATQMLSE
ncbi:hypothetical protein [Knoellia aerolata]|uniref:Uncharacterized protein n=1 Tax=Knoellia aerolata DSM 18566 TaxID=1385519 RepID=A0A0A0JXG7_9MICO|nr:hypothetical protein [Knoellia aerolata]KGN41873.1 hypothetical protein N801_04105 [Knoellia aerolata DSM 18566]